MNTDYQKSYWKETSIFCNRQPCFRSGSSLRNSCCCQYAQWQVTSSLWPVRNPIDE